MLKQVFEFVVDGFGSGETDFAVRLSQDLLMKQIFTERIIDNIVDVLASPDAGAVLSVAGHADRVDTPGLTHVQCLVQEGDAADKRVLSANAEIHAMVQHASPGAPADLDTLSFFSVVLRAPGAGVLKHSGPALTPQQRLENRRVQTRLVVFKK